MKCRTKPQEVEVVQWDGNPELWQDSEKNALLIEAYEEGHLVIRHDYIELNGGRGARVLYKGDYLVKEGEHRYKKVPQDMFDMFLEPCEEKPDAYISMLKKIFDTTMATMEHEIAELNKRLVEKYGEFRTMDTFELILSNGRVFKTEKFMNGILVGEGEHWYRSWRTLQEAIEGIEMLIDTEYREGYEVVMRFMPRLEKELSFRPDGVVAIMTRYARVPKRFFDEGHTIVEVKP